MCIGLPWDESLTTCILRRDGFNAVALKKMEMVVRCTANDHIDRHPLLEDRGSVANAKARLQYDLKTDNA